MQRQASHHWNHPPEALLKGNVNYTTKVSNAFEESSQRKNKSKLYHIVSRKCLYYDSYEQIKGSFHSLQPVI